MKAFAIIMLFMFSGSCSMVSKMVVEKPEIELESIELQKLSWSSVDLNISLKVTNPNSFAIGLANLKYQVFVSGKPVGKGHYAEAFNVPAKKKKSLSIPFSLDGTATLEVAKNYLIGSSQELKAHILGATEIMTPVGSFEIPIDETKVIVKSKP